MQKPSFPKAQNSKSRKTAGFSIIEVMAVVGIMALMTSATVVGFSALGDSLKVSEVSVMIADAIKKAELEVLSQEYKKTTIYFERDYLVMVSEPKGKTLSLSWQGQGGGSCAADEERVTSSDTGNLIKRNGDGVTLNVETITTPLSECVDVSATGRDREWSYQMRDAENLSEKIRFVHFNVYSTLPDDFHLDDNGYSLEVTAPYANKRLYDNGVITQSAASLTIYDEEERVSANIELQI